MVVRAVKKDRQLTQNEERLLAVYRDAALSSHPKPSIDDLADMLGVANGGTIPEITRRLEDMGLIQVERWQRSSRICFPDGVCTALPLNTSPHWRHRPRETPSVSIDTVRSRKPAIAAEIMIWANKRNVALCDAIADLVYVGWMVEKERG